MAEPQRLKVLIVGAGIGGLSAAVALRHQGHEVELFEKSRLASEVGAAVHLAPNCTVLLNRLGIYPETFGSTVYQSFVMRSSDTALKFKKTYQEDRPHWVAEYYLSQRIDLHNALKHAATSPDGPGIPAKLHTASPVASVDCAGGSITISPHEGSSGGEQKTVAGDLVLCADGVHSRARPFVVPDGHYPTFTSGKGSYRWLMPAAELQADPETRIFAEEPGSAVQVAGEDRRVVFYPCANGTVMNCIAFVPIDEVGPVERGTYNQTANKAKLVKHFDGFSPAFIRMLEKAPDGEVMVWDLLDMAVLPTWINGRAALLGDAAHPFLPYMGQGAAQAIEDGCAIAALLPLGISSADVPERLKLYEQCRKERADRVQEYTRVRGRDPTGKQGRPQTPDEFNAAMKDCISHNAWEYALSLLKTPKVDSPVITASVL